MIVLEREFYSTVPKRCKIFILGVAFRVRASEPLCYNSARRIIKRILWQQKLIDGSLDCPARWTGSGYLQHYERRPLFWLERC